MTQTAHCAPQLSREVITLVCGHLRDDGETQTLASLARTAKMFHGPALDALWSSIPGIVPLLRLLPSDIWAVHPELGSVKSRDGQLCVIGTRRAIRPDDFARMRMFAKRVKTVKARHCGQPRSAFICDFLWRSLQDAIQGPLLPNIVSLMHSEVTTILDRNNCMWPAGILVGPKLKYVSLAVRAMCIDRTPAQRIFSDLSRWAPDLQIVKISVDMSSNDYNKSMWLGGEIGGLRHLTYFEAPDIELLPEAVEHLASLPNLNRIVIMTKPADHDKTRFPYTGQRTGRFPSLVDAQIYTDCFVWCAALIRTISSPVLRKLLINNRSCPSSAPVLKVLLAAVGQLPAGPTLRELTIFSGDEQTPLAPGPTIVRAAAMRPLAALTALERLHIGGWCEVILDDATLATLARAWPAFAYLRLYFPHTPCAAPFPFPVSRPLVTLQGLAVFAHACPRLESVFLPVDACVVPGFEPMLGGRHLRRPERVLECARAPALRVFGVGSASLIRDYVRVASYLLLVFPALRHLCHDSNESMWWECIRMHGKFVLVREQERKMRQRRLVDAANTDASPST